MPAEGWLLVFGIGESLQGTDLLWKPEAFAFWAPLPLRVENVANISTNSYFMKMGSVFWDLFVTFIEKPGGLPVACMSWGVPAVDTLIWLWEDEPCKLAFVLGDNGVALHSLLSF